MRCFHGPDALLQPVDEGEVVGSAAKECLAKMNVRLHKPRDHSAVGRINHGIGILSGVSDARDAAVNNEQIATNDGILQVHRHDCAILDED